MRRICLFLGVIFISILSQTIVLGSQSMQGIAINEGTSECIGYNRGDEFTFCKLKEGWKDYYPYDKDSNFDEKFKNCNFSFSNPERCCEELGFILVDSSKAQDCKRTYWGKLDFSLNLLGIITFVFFILLGLSIITLIPYFIIKKKYKLIKKFFITAGIIFSIILLIFIIWFILLSLY